MADDKRSREEQARNDDRRQRERDVAEELERSDETEPPIETADLDALDLDAVTFPATGADVVAAVGGRAVETPNETLAVEDLVPDTDSVTYPSPAAVRVRLQRPTVAAAMRRVVDASETLPNTEFSRSQREAYERTLRALKAIDADDDDEGIEVVTDWIVERIRTKEKLPNSRRVRKRAAEFCRANGYPIRDDEWLGA
jgi:hypothetical protein